MTAGRELLAALGALVVACAGPHNDSGTIAAGATRADAPRIAHYDRWLSIRNTNEMNDKPEMSLMLIADTIIGGGRNVSGLLYIRCRGGKTDAYIVGGTANNNGAGPGAARVQLRFDRGDPIEETWTESTDYQALFSPQPIAFAKRLLSTDTLRFQFDPYTSGTAILRFDVRDLAPHLDSISSLCRWAAADSARTRAAGAERRAADSIHKAYLAEAEFDKQFPFIAEQESVLYYSIYCTTIPGIPKNRQRRFRTRDAAEAAGFRRSMTPGC